MTSRTTSIPRLNDNPLVFLLLHFLFAKLVRNSEINKYNDKNLEHSILNNHNQTQVNDKDCKKISELGARLPYTGG